MKCNHYKELISGYIDYELNKEKKEELENHLKECDSCKSGYDLLNNLQNKLELLHKKEAPEYIWAKIQEKIKEQEKSRKFTFQLPILRLPDFKIYKLVLIRVPILLIVAGLFFYLGTKFKYKKQSYMSVSAGSIAYTPEMSANLIKAMLVSEKTEDFSTIEQQQALRQIMIQLCEFNKLIINKRNIPKKKGENNKL
ncbi:MAG: zf-HC2 domain-containing protein [Elusimicrobia bacterium]|nr:zf-HC2 domain-containing protein [Elusimicrobiota bacterium]